MDGDTAQPSTPDEFPVELVKVVRIAVTTKHKRDCTGQPVVSADEHTATCSYCGTVEVSSIALVD